MECLSSVYEWRTSTTTSPDSSSACSCEDQSAAEQQVQLLQAEVELRQLRDRVRKSLRKWLGDEAQRQKGPPIRIDWQLTAGELAVLLEAYLGAHPSRHDPCGRRAPAPPPTAGRYAR